MNLKFVKYISLSYDLCTIRVLKQKIVEKYVKIFDCHVHLGGKNFSQRIKGQSN